MVRARTARASQSLVAVPAMLGMFLTLHIGEIFSYLFVGSIYVVSDMSIIAQVKPGLRIPNLIVGLILAVLYVFTLLKVPGEIRTFVIIWNAVTVLSMCLGRIIFTIKANRRR